MLTRTASAQRLGRGEVAELAARARIDSRTTAALLAWLPRIEADPALEELALRTSERLIRSAVSPALAELAALPLEAALGGGLTLFYLLVALLEIPAAEERHRAYGINPSISRATWADLAVWCHHLRRREGRPGITLEMLAWAQRALNGSLFRVGSLQFEMEAFAEPVRAYRHRVSGELTLLALPGVSFSGCGRMVAPERGPGTWTAGGALEPDAARGHRIDGVEGLAHCEGMVSLALDTWDLVLGGGDAMLRAHIPADTRVSVADFYRSAREAVEFFATVMPGAQPKGFFGEGWLFDPQVRNFLPGASGIDDLRGLLVLYPGRISEANTLQRLFGSSATRESVVALRRACLNTVQKAVADFVSIPGNRLCARGGFILRDGLAARIDAAQRKGAK